MTDQTPATIPVTAHDAPDGPGQPTGAPETPQAAVTDQPHGPIDYARRQQVERAAAAPTFPDVQGQCPACGGHSLMLADGGYITCRRLECPEPDAATALLERDPWTTPDNPATSSDAADNPLREQRDEARMWARHGYEIGQRHCSWTDYGVAPDWLTEGWPPHFNNCEHLVRASEYEEALTRLRARVQDVADEARGSVRDWLVDALADLPDPRQPSTAATLRVAVADLAQAIRLTREYVGVDLLPAVDGWSWYDALRRWAPHELPAPVSSPAATDTAEPAPDGLRDHLRTALHRFIDPVDDCMPALADDGHGFTWVTTDSVLDEVMAVIGDQSAPTSDNLLREQIVAAITGELNSEKGPSGVIPRIADAVLAVRDRELERLRSELADEQYAYESRTAQWKRVVHSRQHAEQQCRQLAAALTEMLAVPRIPDSGGETAVHIGPVKCTRVERWRGVLKAASQTDGGPSVAEAARWWNGEKEGA